MRWLHAEYLLKGLYLGVLVLAGLRAASPPSWEKPLLVTAASFAGLALALGIAAYAKLRQGYRVRGRLVAFVLFLLLESPTLVYAGILLGTAAGAAALHLLGDARSLAAAVGGGVALGMLFGVLRRLADRRARLGLSLAMGTALVGGAIAYLAMQEENGQPIDLAVLGLQLLLGVPVFYLLTFSGEEEESEVEIGALCAALGLGTALLTNHALQFRPLALGIPVLLYLFYTI